MFKSEDPLASSNYYGVVSLPQTLNAYWSIPFLLRQVVKWVWCLWSLVGHGFRKKEINNWCWTWLSEPWLVLVFPAHLAHSGGENLLVMMSCQSSVSARGVWCSLDPTTRRVQSHTHTVLFHPCPRLTIKESLSRWLPTEPWNVVIRSVATSYFQPFLRYVASKSWSESASTRQCSNNQLHSSVRSNSAT